MSYKTVMSIAELSNYVREVFPESDAYDWNIEHMGNGEIKVTIASSPDHLRPGGTVSGPTMFALADISAYMLILGHIGKVALAVTTSLNINFLSKPEPVGLSAHARLIKLGKRLAICEIHVHSGKDANLVAQATATYSIPPRSQDPK